MLGPLAHTPGAAVQPPAMVLLVELIRQPPAVEAVKHA